MESPFFDLNFCAIASPHFFSGSPVPRYKVSVLIDPDSKEGKPFLEELEEIAKANDVAQIANVNPSGKILISFQGREKPEIYLYDDEEKQEFELELEHDLQKKTAKCKVLFDLKKYYHRRDENFAFTFTPIKITFYLTKAAKRQFEVESGSCTDSGH